MVPGCVPFKIVSDSPILHSRWLLFFKVMIISLWNLLQYHSIVRWAIQPLWAEPLVCYQCTPLVVMGTNCTSSCKSTTIRSRPRQSPHITKWFPSPINSNTNKKMPLYNGEICVSNNFLQLIYIAPVHGHMSPLITILDMVIAIDIWIGDQKGSIFY